ncbi:MAG: phage tail tape measure protein [Bacteroidaceae bacterium]|nr:phage tail tape measure protein [Bacteroidaceae bacterium]
MATRHDIIHIDFQANAGKANVALQALQSEAERARLKVEGLRMQLQTARSTNMPIADIQKLEKELTAATKEAKQWQSALNNNMKGVRALDEAIKIFNKGKGSVEDMNAALSKTALNAAQLQKSRSAEGSKTWKEMDALIVALSQNIMRCNTATNSLVDTIKQGGTASKDTLTKAKSDLQQMIALEEQGSNAWRKYTSQLDVVEGALNKIAAEGQRMAGQDVMKQVFNGTYVTKTQGELERMIQTLRQYQNVIADPEGKGARHFKATERAVKSLTDQLGKAKAASATQVLGNMGNFGVDQIRQAVQQMTQLRDAFHEGTTEWNRYNALVKQGDAYLQQYAEREKIARGEAMSLADALKLSSTAGTSGFTGTTQQLRLAQQAIEQSLATTDKGTAKYQRLQQALARVKAEMSGAGITSQRMQEVLANPKAVKSVDTLKQAVSRARAEMNTMGQRVERMQGLLREAEASGKTAWADSLRKSIKRTSQQMEEMAASTKNADRALKDLEKDSKGSASAFEKAWSRLKTYVTLYFGAAAALQKIRAGFTDLMTLSDKMGEVRKTTGFTANEVGRLSDNLSKLDTRTALTDLMGMASIAGSIGLKTQEQVQGFTIAANKLTVALPEMGQEAARTLMKIADATGDLKKNGGDVENTLERVGSTIIALRANSAAAAGPITDFVSRVGAVGSQAGISIDQIAALGATVDALGGRVEMSATALSRMIPAIRNNSFAVAQAIGITEKELKEMTGMEQMIAIFRALHDSVKGFDMTTEEGMEAAADAVENMMGRSTSMKEVMKQLNQQGARAGIVFGLLSQNVDTLEKQLGIAGKAYKENTALMNEYNNMNETAAAKWERLKNQVEEAFVSDRTQRWLGDIIDRLRKVVDLLTGKGGWSSAIHAVITAWALFKVGFGEAAWKFLVNPLRTAIAGVHSLRMQTLRLAATWRTAWKSMDAATKANWIMAIVSAVFVLGKRAVDAVTRISELDKTLAELDNEEAEAERNLNNLMSSFTAATKKTDEARKKQEELEAQTRQLREEVKELRDGNDESAEATGRLSKKEEELKQAEKDLKKAAGESNTANDERLSLIKEISSKYSTYLGYMLDEKTAAEQVALAHQQIVDALKEELEQKRLNKKIEAIDEETGEDIDKAGAKSKKAIDVLPAYMQRRIINQWNTVRGRIKYDVDEQGNAVYVLPQIEGLNAKEIKKSSYEELRPFLREMYTTIVKNEVEEAQKEGKEIDLGSYTYTTAYGTSTYKNTIDNFLENSFSKFDSWTKKTIEREEKIEEIRSENRSVREGLHASSVADADKMNADAYSRITATLGELTGNEKLSSEVIGTLAQQANIITANLSKFKGELKDADKFIGKDNEASLENAVNFMYSKLSEAQRKQIITAAQKQQGSDSGAGRTNPYGDYDKVTSPYSEWNGNDLVARRKEMLERVKTLANGADVQAVLSEDAKFISEAVRKNITTTEQAIEWYNTERLKIQDALYNKHLTPTGDWLDPKKSGGNWRKQLQNEFDNYLNILDAYYTERKARIEQAQAEEGLSEAEAQRLTIENETVWRRHRIELQQIYQGKSADIAEEERQRIYNILAEQDEDSAEFVEQTIQKSIEKMKILEGKSEVEYHKIMSKIVKDIATDLYKQQNAVSKQMEAITAIIAQERPFNGLTENLESNLSTMGILFADFDRIRREAIEAGLEPEDDMSQRAEQSIGRMLLLLNAAENAYSTSWEQLKEKMQEEGLGDWAAALEIDEQKIQAVIASLHSFYDQVQDAIKKEASQIKKQADIVWNDTTIPGADGQSQSMKGVFDKTISQLGLEEGRVSRANSLIGAGQASERVADRLAIKQMEVRLAMQRAYYDLIKKKGADHIAKLEKEAELLEEQGKMEEAAIKRLDVKHAKTALALSDAEEQTKIMELQNSLAEKAEESQARLYKKLREWGDLLASSVQSIMEAGNAGQADYYNELAKLELTGKGGPGAGTYVVVDNADTKDAKAHYEYLDERQALDRQLEIEQENARAEAWRKVWDDINTKMNDTITDQLNAMFQNSAIDANTSALNTLTGAVDNLAGVMGGASAEEGGLPTSESSVVDDEMDIAIQKEIDANTKVTDAKIANKRKEGRISIETDKQMSQSSKNMYAAMMSAANLYGAAYQAVTNDNLSAEQKFSMIALQAAGQSAIAMMQAKMFKSETETLVSLPEILAQCLNINPIAGTAIFAVLSALLGAAIGVATSKLAKGKAEVAQVTGASSASAGRLSTGMLTYAEGNVNEFTEPGSLTPGRQYNVDAADGKTYRAKYTGRNPRTHITSGPEFHLVGEAGREAIIDAKTTRNIQMNEPEIWRSIQTLYNGGMPALRRSMRRGRGVRAYAEGNIDDFDVMTDSTMDGGMSMEMAASLQQSIDRQSDLLERALTDGIKGVFSVYGKGGLVDSYDTGKKTVTRYGENY